MILGGKTFDELGLVLLKTTQIPILPSTRDQTVQIPGRHGAYDFGADSGPRQFNLECAIKADTRQELTKKIRALVAHLIDTNGRPRTLELIFDEEPEKFYYVRYAGSISLERIANVGRFVLPLVAYDPFAHADIGAFDTSLQYDTGLQYDIGLIYPNPTKMNWFVKRQVTSQMNYGHVEVGPVIKISGACTNPTIRNETTGKVLTWMGTMSIGDMLEIDMERMTIKLNDKNALPGISGDFWKLVIGANALAFESDTTPNAVIDIDYDHLFL